MGNLVRTTVALEGHTECPTNARLIIVAAPETAAQRDELLEALEGMVTEATVATDSEQFAFFNAVDAISKARGGRA